MGGKPRSATLRGQPAGATENEEGGIFFLTSLLQAVPAIVLRVDDEFKIQYINKVQPGYSREDVIGASAFAFIPPENAAMARAVYEQVLATGIPGEFVVELPYPDGTWYVFKTFVTRVPPINGRYALCAVALDVSEQTTQQKKLAANEEMLRMAIDASQVALFQWDARTDQIEWNDRMKAIAGTDLPLTFDQWVNTLTHPDDRAGAKVNFDELMRTGRFGPTLQRIIRPDGETRWILSSSKAYFSNDRVLERLVGGIVDISEQQRLEEQLRKSQRMEAVGSLTAGIAHNFNNMLMVIQPCLDVIEELLEGKNRIWAQDAIQASSRAAEMVAQLMTFGGQQPALVQEYVSIPQACEAAATMSKRAFDSSIDVVWDAQTEAVIECQRGDLEQVLVNLLMNARDSLESNSSNKPRIELHAHDVKSEHGPRVRLEVRDNGTGMSEATRARVFDPFFTTKAEKGTGLGLASCHTIIQRIGGTIDCVSVRGKGTTFTIELPVAAKTPNQVRPALPDTEAPLSAKASEAESADANAVAPRVLIVDDEIAIRRIVTVLLESGGISSTSVGSVDEARTHLDTYANYDLVLLDRSMPGVQGSALIPALRSKVPRAKIIFFTGHDIGEQEASLVDGIVAKPLRGEALLGVVREALASVNAP